MICKAPVSDIQIEAWLNEVGENALKPEWRANEKQKEIINKVTRRVIEQERSLHNPLQKRGEPLLWLLHGGPGAGKSHVIRMIKEELFEKNGVAAWN